MAPYNDDEFAATVDSLMGQISGLEEPEESFWRRNISGPVGSVFGATQHSIAGPVLGGFDIPGTDYRFTGLAPESYKKAAAELQQETGVGPEQTGFRSWEALPGAGRVLTQLLPEGTPGAVKMPLQMLGDVLADPSTWVPWLVLGRAGRVGAKAIEAGVLAGKVSPAAYVGRAGLAAETGAALKGVEAHKAVVAGTRKALEEIGRPDLLRTYNMLTAAGLGGNAAMAGVAGMAFAPSVAEGAWQASKQALEKVQEGEYGEAAAAGGTVILMGGLGYLTARGIMSPWEAGEVLRKDLSTKVPVAAGELGQRAAAAAEPMQLPSYIGPERQLERGPLLMPAVPEQVPELPFGGNVPPMTELPTRDVGLPRRPGQLPLFPGVEPRPLPVGEGLPAPPPLVPEGMGWLPLEPMDRDVEGMAAAFSRPSRKGAPKVEVPLRPFPEAPVRVVPEVEAPVPLAEVREPSLPEKADLSQSITEPENVVAPREVTEPPAEVNATAEPIAPEVTNLGEGQAPTATRKPYNVKMVNGVERRDWVADVEQDLKATKNKVTGDVVAKYSLPLGVRKAGELREYIAQRQSYLDSMVEPPAKVPVPPAAKPPAMPVWDELVRKGEELPKRADDPRIAGEVDELVGWLHQNQDEVGFPADERAITEKLIPDPTLRRFARQVWGGWRVHPDRVPERFRPEAPPVEAAPVGPKGKIDLAALKDQLTAPEAIPTKLQELERRQAEIEARINARMAKTGRSTTATIFADPTEFAANFGDMVEWAGVVLQKKMIPFEEFLQRLLDKWGEEWRPYAKDVWLKATGAKAAEGQRVGEYGVETVGPVSKKAVVDEATGLRMEPPTQGGRKVWRIVDQPPPFTEEENQALQSFLQARRLGSREKVVPPLYTGERSPEVIDALVREEIAKRKVPPAEGTPQWNTLYDQYQKEVTAGHGEMVGRLATPEAVEAANETVAEWAARSPEWRGMKPLADGTFATTEAQKVEMLRRQFTNAARNIEREAIEAKKAQMPVVEGQHAGEGGTGRVVERPIEEVAGGEAGVRREASQKVRQAHEVGEKKSEAQRVSERVHQRLREMHPEADEDQVFAAYAKTLPREVIRGEGIEVTAKGKTRANPAEEVVEAKPEVLQEQLNLFHLISRNAEPTAANMQGVAKQFGVGNPVSLTAERVSRLRTIYQNLVWMNPEFRSKRLKKVPADVDNTLADLAKTNVELRVPEVHAGVQAPEGGVLEFVHGGLAKNAPLGSVETTTYRLTAASTMVGPGPRVSIEFARSDTPGSRVVVNKAGLQAIESLKRLGPKGRQDVVERTKPVPVEATGITLTGSSGNSPEGVADMLGSLFRSNTSIARVTVGLKKVGEGVTMRGNPTLQSALRILEDEGIIRLKRVPGVEAGVQAAPTLMPKGGGVLPRGPSQVSHRPYVLGKSKVLTRVERFLADREEKASELAERWVAEHLKPGATHRPVAAVFEVVGAERPAAADVARSHWLGVGHDRWPEEVREVERLHTLDMLDSAREVGGVRIVNLEGVHDPDTLARIGRAHAPMVAELRGVTNDIAKAAGLDAEFGGVAASPFTHEVVAMEGGKPGHIVLTPLHAHYKAMAEGTGLRGAAKELVNNQIVHALAHVEEQAILHGDTFEGSMVKVSEKLHAMEGQYEGMVERLSRPELWKGLEDEADGFAKLVEERNSGRLREGWRGAEEGVGGLRAGVAEGGPDALRNRRGEGAYGAAAGRGPGVRPGAAVPEGAGGAARAVGEAPPGRPGGEPRGRGGPAQQVPEGGAGGQRQGTVRLYRVETQGQGKGAPEWVKEHTTYKNTVGATGRWFTDDLQEARWYLEDNPGSKIVTLDVPAAEAERYRVSNLPEVLGGKGAAENPRAFSRRPEKEFFLPKDMAGRARVEGRQVAFSKPASVAESWTAVRDELERLTDPGVPKETKRGKIWGLAFEASQALKKAAEAGDAAAKAEWEKRVKAGPTGKGAAWARMNNVFMLVHDDAKVSQSFWSEYTAKDPELSRGFLADTPITFDEIDEATKKVLAIESPEDIERRIRQGGKRLTVVDVNVARSVSTDLVSQWRGAEMRYLDGLEKASNLSGDELTKFSTGMLAKLDGERLAAENRMALVDIAINETGTVPARKLAIRKMMLAAQDPWEQQLMKAQEAIRQQLQGKWKGAELDKTVGRVMSYLRAGDNKGFREALRGAQQYDKLDQFLEFYKGGLIGWPARPANIGSNGLFFHALEFEKNMGALFENVLAKVQDRPPERSMREWLLYPRIMRRAWAGGIGPWMRAQKDALMLKDPELTQKGFTDDVMKDFIHIPGAISGKKGNFFRYQFNGMNADDVLAKHWLKVSDYYHEILPLVEKGVKGWERRPGESLRDALERHVDDLEQHVAAASDKGVPLDPKYRAIHNRAGEQARVGTFQETQPGWAKGMQQGMHEGGGRFLQIPVPFWATPFNIAKQVLKRTPLEWPVLLAKWSKMTRAERIDATARHTTAAMMVGGLWTMMEGSGLEVSGNGPIDPEANQLMRESGWAPYSVKVGDKWYSYQRFEPMSSLLGMIADAHEGFKAGDFDRFGTGMQRAVGTVAQNITSKTFLTGFENASNLFSDPQRYGGQWVKQTLSGLVPNALGYVPFGHLAREIDPTYRETGLDPLKIIQAKLPWASQLLPPQYAPTGEERERPDTLGPRVVSPVAVTTEKKTPEARAARMLADIGFPMRRVRSEFSYKGMKVPITPEEQRELAGAQAKALAFIGARLMNDPTFQALPNNEDEAEYPGQKTKKDVLARIVRKFREPVVARMNPDLRQRSARLLGSRREERRAELGPGA